MKAKVFLSLLIGAMFFTAAYFILLYIDNTIAFPYALACGIMSALILFPVLVIHENYQEKRYAELEKHIDFPVSLKANGNFTLAPGVVKNGNIYFCEDRVIFLSLDTKPVSKAELLFSDINKYEIDRAQLHIYAKGGQAFLITTPDTPKIEQFLRENHQI